MKVIITGSTGLIGSALVRALLAEGHSVTRLVRRASDGARADGTSGVLWNPDAGTIDAAALEGHDAAVHLAGDPIADGRWTDEKKRRIRESRTKGTRLIAETLAGLARKPEVLVSASGVGFYGSRGDEILREESASGEDFLSEVCREWEISTLPASEAGIRVVHTRIGVVLSRDGGALQKMLPPFKLGVGGRLGSGEQYMSWIDLEDLVRIIKFVIEHKSLRGPVNAVSNAEFTKTLGGVLGRPTLLTVPAFAARLAFGEMADSTVLVSQRAEPARLKEAGYEFAYTNLESSLRNILRA